MDSHHSGGVIYYQNRACASNIISGAAMTVRKTKKGKVYYSCLGYPDCKFMSWDIPTGDKCPECQNALVKMGRNGVKCSNRECSYKIAGKTERKTAVEMDDDFTPPPLEEPVYFSYDDGDFAGFFPPDFKE